MLYRRFIILTMFIAIVAVAVVNVIQTSTASHRSFSVSDRLKQWELQQQRETCPRDNRLCHTEVVELNKV